MGESREHHQEKNNSIKLRFHLSQCKIQKNTVDLRQMQQDFSYYQIVPEKDVKVNKGFRNTQIYSKFWNLHQKIKLEISKEHSK